MRLYRCGASAAVLVVLLLGATPALAQLCVGMPLSVGQTSFRLGFDMPSQANVIGHRGANQFSSLLSAGASYELLSPEVGDPRHKLGADITMGHPLGGAGSLGVCAVAEGWVSLSDTPRTISVPLGVGLGGAFEVDSGIAIAPFQVPQLVWTRQSAGEASISGTDFRIEGGVSLAISSFAQEEPSPKSQSQEKKWLIEPIKLTSLMVNTHPEYNGWGFEVGRKLTDKRWVTSMIEKTKGGDFLKNFDPAYDFLITFKYFAWLNTFRYYLKPGARYSTFFDAGVEYQSAGHKFLRDNIVFEEKAKAVGPIMFVGGEWHFSENMYLKWRSGFFVNVYRGGDMKSRIDDGQDQPAFFMYPHLADAVIGKGTYAGDVAFGIKL